MKKAYTKPSLYVERLSLTQTIASGCGISASAGTTLGTPNHWGKSDCGWDMGNLVVWTDTNAKCDFPWGADDAFDGICYNNPDGRLTIFASL